MDTYEQTPGHLSEEEARRLSPDDAWAMADGIERTEGPESALPLYRGLVGDGDVGIKAEYRLGRGLLRAGDEAGLDHLRWVAFSSEDDDLSMVAAYEACDYLMKAGRELEAAPYHARWLELRDHMLPVYEERCHVLPNDRFLPHGLREDVVARIQEGLGEGPKLWRAYLVQKRVKVKPESPAYVLGLMVQCSVMVRVRGRG